MNKHEEGCKCGVCVTALRQQLSSAEDRIQLQMEKIATLTKELDEAMEALANYDARWKDCQHDNSSEPPRTAGEQPTKETL